MHNSPVLTPASVIISKTSEKETVSIKVKPLVTHLDDTSFVKSFYFHFVFYLRSNIKTGKNKNKLQYIKKRRWGAPITLDSSKYVYTRRDIHSAWIFWLYPTKYESDFKTYLSSGQNKIELLKFEQPWLLSWIKNNIIRIENNIIRIENNIIRIENNLKRPTINVNSRKTIARIKICSATLVKPENLLKTKTQENYKQTMKIQLPTTYLLIKELSTDAVSRIVAWALLVHT